jgi:hypothetical protein
MFGLIYVRRWDIIESKLCSNRANETIGSENPFALTDHPRDDTGTYCELNHQMD